MPIASLLLLGDTDNFSAFEVEYSGLPGAPSHIDSSSCPSSAAPAMECLLPANNQDQVIQDHATLLLLNCC
jgi:hypothetical protein